MKVHVVYRERLNISKKNVFHLIMHFFSVYVCTSFFSFKFLYFCCSQTQKKNVQKQKRNLLLLFLVWIRNCKMVIFHMIVHSHLYTCISIFLLMLLLALLTRVCMRITKRKKKLFNKGRRRRFCANKKASIACNMSHA